MLGFYREQEINTDEKIFASQGSCSMQLNLIATQQYTSKTEGSYIKTIICLETGSHYHFCRCRIVITFIHCSRSLGVMKVQLLPFKN